MKKGIFFALLFGAFFLLILSILLFYGQNVSAREAALLENKKIGKLAYIADDIGGDLQTFMGIDSVSIHRNSSHAIIGINDTFPTGHADPAADLANYKKFIEGPYALKNNLQGRISLDLTRFSGGPFIYFGGPEVNYSYSDLSKTSATFRGSSSIDSFEFSLSSSENFQSCGWRAQDAGSLAAKISPAASNCPQFSVSLDPNSQNEFWINTSSGKYLNITIGSVDGHPYSYKITPNGVAANVFSNTTIATALPIRAWIPAALSFTEDYSLAELSLKQN